MRQTVANDLTHSERPTSKTDQQCCQLNDTYQNLVASARFNWSSNLRFIRKLGIGGQGIVYLAERTGSDEFTLPVAAKIFSPERYRSLADYDSEMARIGHVATRIARIQHENLVDVDHFLNRDRIRIMIMEWIEGYDLRKLLTAKMYGVVKDRVSKNRWNVFNEQLITAGPIQPRLNSRVVGSITRDCLSALAAIHDEGIIHGDVKPANIMINRNGKTKIIDVGSSIDTGLHSPINSCTPAYAAPQVLAGGPNTAATDLISLGYVALELLCGQPLFGNSNELPVLLKAKQRLTSRLPELLPRQCEDDKCLIDFSCDLIALDNRLPNSESPGPTECTGSLASGFLKKLSKICQNTGTAGLIRCWIEELLEIDEMFD